MSTNRNAALSKSYFGNNYIGFVFFLLAILGFVQPTYSQLHDYTWILGYDGGPDMPVGDSFGLSILKFADEKLTIVAEEEKGSMFFNM